MRLDSRVPKRKIIILSSSEKTPSHFGRVYYFAKELARRNSVYVVSVLNESFRFKAAFESIGSLRIIKIVIPRIPFFSFFGQLIFFLLIANYLCISKKRSIIMAHDPIGGLATFFVSKSFHVSPVFDFLDNYKSYTRWYKHPFIYFIIEKIIVNNVDALVFASDMLREDINHRYNLSNKTRQIVIPNGVDIELFYPMKKSYARKKTNMPISSKIILYSGAIEYNRGIPTLLMAFSCLLKELPNLSICLVVTGKGQALPECKVLASKLRVQDKILFINWLPYEQIPFYVNSADVTVLPNAENEFTRFCTSPLKIMEYMACSKPIVTTNVGMCGRIVGNERGIVVPPEDPKKMACALKTLLVKKNRPRILGLNAYKLATKDFSWKHLVSKLERFLDKNM